MKQPLGQVGTSYLLRCHRAGPGRRRGAGPTSAPERGGRRGGCGVPGNPGDQCALPGTPGRQTRMSEPRRLSDPYPAVAPRDPSTPRDHICPTFASRAMEPSKRSGMWDCGHRPRQPRVIQRAGEGDQCPPTTHASHPSRMIYRDAPAAATRGGDAGVVGQARWRSATTWTAPHRGDGRGRS